MLNLKQQIHHAFLKSVGLTCTSNAFDQVEYWYQ